MLLDKEPGLRNDFMVELICLVQRALKNETQPADIIRELAAEQMHVTRIHVQNIKQ